MRAAPCATTAPTAACSSVADSEKANPLARYWAKRNFAVTAEPRGEHAPSGQALSFVIQKHAATRLHYDFRLELDGVLLSWAVPRGPSFDPTDKRMAIHTEDHPLSYGGFEGTIPRGQYGAGTVIVWDNGTWIPKADPRQGLKDGKLVFELQGHKLHGLWELVKIAKPGERQEAWLLFKKRDAFAKPRSEYDVVSALPDSVIARPLKAPPAEASPDGVPRAAKQAPLPATMTPQLASLATVAPTSGAWSYEIKLDGYRLMTRIDGGRPKLITRGGHDWSAKMPGLVKALQGLNLGSAWLDGEIVVIGADGTPDFNALQNAFDRSRTEGIDYFLFDLPYLEGYDLRALPLIQRRQLLKQLFDDSPHDERLRFSESFDADAASILESARRMGLEGVIAKRKDSPYESRRSEHWLKLKNKQRQEFVVAGYTDRSSGEAEVGSLLLAVHDDQGQLAYVGNVGTGWSAQTARDLRAKLQAIETKASAFGDKPLHKHRWSTAEAKARHWVKPQLVAEVEFSDWTPDDQVRHAKFLGLRADKDAKGVKRESAITPAGPGIPVAAGDGMVGGIKVSHPQRVIDPGTGITKLELVRYYESVAQWMLPHLKGRPCSLVRGPEGVGGQLFFQKHIDAQQIADIKQLDTALLPGHEPLLEVSTEKALIAAAQMNVIEFHTWNAPAKKFATPDRVVFDLDPGEGERWERVVEAASLVRALLQELGLQSWLKTSGGKGLHLVVPLKPRDDWDTVKDFAQAVVVHLAKVIPQRFVAKSGAGNRVGKIFVDWLRNNHGATTAAAFSARARPGLGVSMPLPWDALPSLKRSDQWSVRTAREHLSFQSVDPWQDYWTCKQTLTEGLQALGVKRAAAPSPKAPSPKAPSRKPARSARA
jgi:bifunctional non-homologous end joining protein LigD